MQQAAEDLFQKFEDPCANELFMVLYQDLAEDLGLQGPSQEGSSEHLQAVYQRAKHEAINLKKGNKFKGARWFSFFQAIRPLESSWALMLMVLLWMGLRNGWFATLSESPLFKPWHCAAAGSGESEGQGRPPPEPSAADPQHKGVKGSDEKLPRLRRACKNTMHVACTLLADRGCDLRCRCWALRCGPPSWRSAK